MNNVPFDEYESMVREFIVPLSRKLDEISNHICQRLSNDIDKDCIRATIEKYKISLLIVTKVDVPIFNTITQRLDKLESTLKSMDQVFGEKILLRENVTFAYSIVLKAALATDESQEVPSIFKNKSQSNFSVKL